MPKFQTGAGAGGGRGVACNEAVQVGKHFSGNAVWLVISLGMHSDKEYKYTVFLINVFFAFFRSGFRWE